MGTLVCKNKNEFLLHPSVVFTPERTNLGVRHHTLWKRPEGNTAGRYHTPIEEKESYHWITSYKISCQLQKQHPDTLVVETIWRGYVRILNYLEIAAELSAMNTKNICV